MGPVWYSSMDREECQTREVWVVVNIAYPFVVLCERIDADKAGFVASTMPSEVGEQVRTCRFAGGDTVYKVGTFDFDIV